MAYLLSTTCGQCQDEINVVMADGKTPDPDEVIFCGPCREDRFRYWEDEASVWAEIEDAEARAAETYRAGFA